MDLVSYNAEDLSSFRPNDYFFEPASRKIYQYRNKEGKAVIVREIGTQHITKLFKNTLKTILKVEGSFDKYQVIGISDTSLTLFNTNIGESFEVGLGDVDNINEIKLAFNQGDEIIADVFDYDDIQIAIKLNIASSSSTSSTAGSVTEPQEIQVSSSELQRIKEIEEKKAKKRPFTSTESMKIPPKITPKTPVSPSKSTQKTTPPTTKDVKTETKKAETQVKAESKKTEPTIKVEAKKEEKKVELPPKKEEKAETKEEKKEREKKEKETQKELEKKQKEQDKAKKGKK